jgi:hypothetical protein
LPAKRTPAKSAAPLRLDGASGRVEN